MNKKLISSGLAAISLILGTVIIKPIEARLGQHTFSCVNVNGVPTTVSERGGKKVNMIRWAKNDNAFGDEWTPQRRCNEVSAKFQKYSDQGKLRFITHGIKDGYPIVCVASSKGGSCTGQLFTLRKGDNAEEKVRRLFNTNKISNGSGALDETDPTYISTNNNQVYIDINIYLTNAETSIITQSLPSNNNNTTSTDDDCWFCN